MIDWPPGQYKPFGYRRGRRAIIAGIEYRSRITFHKKHGRSQNMSRRTEGNAGAVGFQRFTKIQNLRSPFITALLHQLIGVGRAKHVALAAAWHMIGMGV